MLCVQFRWKWPSGSGSRRFKISTMYFCDYLPLERGVSFTCKTWIPFTQRCVGRVILEKLIWKLYRRTDRRRAIRNFCICIWTNKTTLLKAFTQFLKRYSAKSLMYVKNNNGDYNVHLASIRWSDLWYCCFIWITWYNLSL